MWVRVFPSPLLRPLCSVLVGRSVGLLVRVVRLVDFLYMVFHAGWSGRVHVGTSRRWGPKCFIYGFGVLVGGCVRLMSWFVVVAGGFAVYGVTCCVPA